ncbi:MAG: YaeQ family protein [Spirochaetaceae bacterium]|nr:YaeQ family protein [Spirochaetaceae bacterium]
MAIKSVVYKAELDVADLDRNYYAAHSFTLACHPSETETRMMIGLVAFALNAHERLAFSRGLAEPDEPDLWQRDLAGELELWIELGHPDERRLAKACGRSRAVIVYTYSASPELWWNPIAGKLSRCRNLAVHSLDPSETRSLSDLVKRSMRLSCTIQDGGVWLRDDDGQDARLGVRTIK